MSTSATSCYWPQETSKEEYLWPRPVQLSLLLHQVVIQRGYLAI